jgi:hypothetical protein
MSNFDQHRTFRGHQEIGRDSRASKLVGGTIFGSHISYSTPIRLSNDMKTSEKQDCP